MSSKDSKGSSDSLSTKSKKKDKTKKEKKEKKEKSKKRDSKDLETVHDVGEAENQIEGNADQESSSKSKKFGFFRLSGKKSKSSKHGSQDSLKGQSRESLNFERSGSEFSLEESTGLVESATAGKLDVLAEKNALDPNKTSKGAKGESEARTSNETEIGNAALAERLSEPEKNSPIQSDLTDDNGSFDKTNGEQAGTEDSSPKEDSPADKLQKEDLLEPVGEPPNISENNPSAENIEGSSLGKLKEELFVISKTETTKASEDNPSNITDEVQKERVSLMTEEKTSSRKEESGNVVSLGYGSNHKVTLEDSKAPNEQEITSSENESVDTVISTGNAKTGDFEETTDQTENEKLSEFDVEEYIFSTHKERKGPQLVDHQDDQDETPVDEEAIMLVYPEKQPVQNENKSQEDSEENEQLIALTVDNKENRVEEQVNELLKLDLEKAVEDESEAAVDEVKKEEGAEKSPNVEESTTKRSPKGSDIADERPKQFRFELVSSSTPEGTPVGIVQNTRIKTRVLRPIEGSIAHGQRAVNVSSVVEYQLRVYIVKTIKEVKVSSKVLLVQLAEINKKLQALKWELLEVQDSGKDDTHQPKPEEAHVKT